MPIIKPPSPFLKVIFFNFEVNFELIKFCHGEIGNEIKVEAWNGNFSFDNNKNFYRNVDICVFNPHQKAEIRSISNLINYSPQVRFLPANMTSSTFEHDVINTISANLSKKPLKARRQNLSLCSDKLATRNTTQCYQRNGIA